METLSSNIPKPLSWNNFQNTSSSSPPPCASSGLVCPNCRASLSLSPCVALCSLGAPPSCHGSCPSSSCPFAPSLPMPYVCRHWMQVAPACAHLHPAHNPWPLPPKPPHQPCRSSDAEARQNSAKLLQKELWAPPPPALGGVGRAWSKEDEARALRAATEALRESGWFHGALTWQEAAALLAPRAEGTFLVRQSSSRVSPFAVSVQTPQGPTSIRVEFEGGLFWLACERRGVTPQLPGVVELIEFYRALARAKDADEGDAAELLRALGPPAAALGPQGRHVWVDHRGRVFCPIKIVTPLRKGPASLQHLSRLALRGGAPQLIPALPQPLREYMDRYPHRL